MHAKRTNAGGLHDELEACVSNQVASPTEMASIFDRFSNMLGRHNNLDARFPITIAGLPRTPEQRVYAFGPFDKKPLIPPPEHLSRLCIMHHPEIFFRQAGPNQRFSSPRAEGRADKRRG